MDQQQAEDLFVARLRDPKATYSLKDIVTLGTLLDGVDENGDTPVLDAAINVWLRIRPKSGRVQRFTLNPAQRQLSRAWGQRNIVLKARQLGITTYVAARFFIQTITQPGTLSVQVAHDQDAAEEIFRIVHRFLERLPKDIRSELRTSRSNVRQIVFPRIDSEYRVETAADPNAGRGLTIQNLHCSEVARWTGDAAEALASVRAAVPPTGSIVLESTPNGAAGVFYDEWNRAPETGYVQHFFPWWLEKSYQGDARHVQTKTAEELALIQREGLTDRQIAFRRGIRANFRRGLAAQEFAEDATSCFRASGECVFDRDAIEQRLAALSLPAQTRTNGTLEIFFPPQADNQYVIGIDPAGGGIDGDYACAQIVDRSSGFQCAELHAHLTPQELAHAVAELGREYNDALLAVERNNHGHAVLAYLDTNERYNNVYMQRGTTGAMKATSWNLGNAGSSPGWLTTVASRPRIIERLAAFLSHDAQLFHSRGLLEECRTFIRDANGVPTAASGAHDDRVLAMAIALEVREITSGALRMKTSAAHA
jgi:Terminase RNaseH-like domain